jgi:hypothetical protein
MPVGFPTKTTYANGDVFSASDINDTNGTLNLLGSSVAYAAGKNRIINGDFEVWQRGTSISVAAGSNVFTSDRWQAFIVGTTCTASRQTFTPGAAPVAGYEGEFFHRIATGASTTYYELQQRIEDVRTLAGQTATYSFWAKATNAHTAAVYINQNFGVSGSANVGTASQNISLTTSWQRFTLTFSIPSISGKTVGASSYINPFIYYVSGTVANTSIDIWGVQLEQGSTATAFQTATGSIQGELAACQRYYWRQTTAGGDACATGAFYDSTRFIIVMPLKQTMRVTPTFSSSAGNTFQVIVNAALKAGSSTSSAESNTQMVRWDIVTATGATGGQAGYAQAASAGYYDFNAEL